MSENGLENFANVITVLAALGGVIAAWAGLFTWRRQQRWQEGRGLAMSLLRSANNVMRHAKQVQKEFIFYEATKKSIEERRVTFASFSKKAEDYLNKLQDELEMFETATVEATLVWNEKFSDQVSCFRDSEHSIRAFLLSGLGMIAPDAHTLERKQSGETNAMFHKHIYGNESVYRSMRIAIGNLEAKLLERFPR